MGRTGVTGARFFSWVQVLPQQGWCPSLTEATEEPPASPHELATTAPGQAACTMNLEKAGEGTRGVWPGQRAVRLLGGTHVVGLPCPSPAWR